MNAIGHESRGESADPCVEAAERPLLFLASRSPRRRQFLTDARLRHEADHPGLEDSELTSGAVSPKEWVAALAYLKASAGAEVARGREPAERTWVLGADTACVSGGELIGTPADVAEARRMLRSFRDSEHEVVTGVALIELEAAAGVHAVPRRRSLFATAANVRWGHVSDEQIEQYLATGGWAGKAGGYNLRERLAAGWAIACEGDPTCVMGLPMDALKRKLGVLRSVWPADTAGTRSDSRGLKSDDGPQAAVMP